MAKNSRNNERSGGQSPQNRPAPSAVPPPAAPAQVAAVSPAPAKGRRTARVIFRVSTPPGHPAPCLVGSAPELGVWEPSAAHAMAPAGAATFAVELALTPEQIVEYKYVWRDAQKNLHWEAGANRHLAVVSGDQTAEGGGLRLG